MHQSKSFKPKCMNTIKKYIDTGLEKININISRETLCKKRTFFYVAQTSCLKSLFSLLCFQWIQSSDNHGHLSICVFLTLHFYLLLME